MIFSYNLLFCGETTGFYTYPQVLTHFQISNVFYNLQSIELQFTDPKYLHETTSVLQYCDPEWYLKTLLLNTIYTLHYLL